MTSVKKSLQQRGKLNTYSQVFLQKVHLYRCCRDRRACFCTSLLCGVCVTAIYFSGLSELGKHNLVLIIKPPGHVPERSEANSWYICDVHINISTTARQSSSPHRAAGRDALPRLQLPIRAWQPEKRSEKVHVVELSFL